MSIASTAQIASKVVADLLRNSQLDSIRVYSLIVQLGFIQLGADENFPKEIWISISGALEVSRVPEKPTKLQGDFFQRRAAVLQAIFQFIGGKVTDVKISQSGVLRVDIDDKYFLFAWASEEGDLEEVWEVTSDSPDADVPHRWCVSLDDVGNISISRPD